MSNGRDRPPDNPFEAAASTPRRATNGRRAIGCGCWLKRQAGIASAAANGCSVCLQEVAIVGGGPVAVVIDPVARNLLGERIRRQLPDARLMEFGGECTAAEIAARAAETGDARLLIGVGGGKAIDTAKGAAIERGLPVAIVPTIASNDSPTSHIAVVYTTDHAVEGVRRMKTNPVLVLVDTAVIAGAPRRFLAAGIGDAMSKPYELAGALAGGGLNFFSGRPTELTQAIVSRAQEILLADSEAAMAAAAPDEAFERVVEAAVLLSGLAFESGGLSIAHAMVRGLSVMPALGGLLHGEMVALGTLTQLAAGQGSAEEIRALAGFFRRIGLPTGSSYVHGVIVPVDGGYLAA